LQLQTYGWSARSTDNMLEISSWLMHCIRFWSTAGRSIKAIQNSVDRSAYNNEMNIVYEHF